jgi:hypothetical protein
VTYASIKIWLFLLVASLSCLSCFMFRCVGFVDLSFFRAGPGLGRVKKNYVISGWKNPTHDHPTGRIKPQFSGWARAGPELGRAARTFYSVKQLKTAFRAGLGSKKKFTGFKISAHTRPVRFVCGPGAGRAWAGSAGRAGLKMLMYLCIFAFQELFSSCIIVTSLLNWKKRVMHVFKKRMIFILE